MWGIGNTVVSKPKFILKRACILLVETNEGKLATMPGGDVYSKTNRAKWGAKLKCYLKWGGQGRLSHGNDTEQRPEQREGVSHATLQGENVPNKENSDPVHGEGSADTFFFKLRSLSMFFGGSEDSWRDF